MLAFVEITLICHGKYIKNQPKGIIVIISNIIAVSFLGNYIHVGQDHAHRVAEWNLVCRSMQLLTASNFHIQAHKNTSEVHKSMMYLWHTLYHKVHVY